MTDRTVEELADHPPVGYATTALDGTILAVNDTFLEWLGHDSGSLVGVRRLDQLMTAGSRVIYLTHHVPRLEVENRLAGISVDFRRADGTIQPTFVACQITTDDTGARVIKAILFDATERRAFEHDLVNAKNAAESAASYLGLLHEVASACARNVTTETVAQAVVAAAVKGFTATAGALWIHDERSQQIERIAAVGDIDALIPLSFPIDSPDPVARACRVGVTQTATRANGSDALAALMDQTGIDAKVCVPLPFEHSVLGVLGLYVRRTEPLASADLALIETLGHQVGQALERSRLIAELQRKAMHDALTGLPNRVLLHDRLDVALARAPRMDHGVLVLAIDLNGFKDVNDRLGHAAGDEVLIEVARRLEKIVRPADTVARLGGDEFVIVCEDVTPDCSERLARRVVEAIDVEAGDGDVRLRVTASVGYARHEATDEPISVGAVLERADAAMYRIKQRR